MFSFYMTANPDYQSELLFGGYDEDKFEGVIQWHPIVDQVYWSVQLDDIKLNGKPFNLC
jgi:hypothetical protein